MHNHGPDVFLDDVRQHCECRRQAGVVVVGEDILVATCSPVYIEGRVDGFLDIRAVEVER
jgi:hypothetical protein